MCSDHEKGGAGREFSKYYRWLKLVLMYFKSVENPKE